MAILNYFAAGIMTILGGLHLIYALYDLFFHPRYFRPADKALMAAMQKTHPSISPHARNYWLSVVGFNISHAIGVLLFALLIILAADEKVSYLQPGLIAVAMAYTFISWKCWFFIPTLGSAITAILLAAALML